MQVQRLTNDVKKLLDSIGNSHLFQAVLENETLLSFRDLDSMSVEELSLLETAGHRGHQTREEIIEMA
jgi:hypothetical protein